MGWARAGRHLVRPGIRGWYPPTTRSSVVRAARIHARGPVFIRVARAASASKGCRGIVVEQASSDAMPGPLNSAGLRFT